MHKSATKCNETVGKWCKNKHGASKIIDTFEMYQWPLYIGGQVSGIGRDPIQITISTYDVNSYFD
jgi:hypothetical protein